VLINCIRMDYQGRQRRLKGVLDRHRLDALLIKHLPNVRYLCGFTGSAGALLVTESKTLFFTDGRYKQQARAEADASVVISRKSALVAAAEWLKAHAKKLGVRTVGFESQYLTVAELRQLRAIVPSGVRLKEAPALVEEFRAIKDTAELDRLRAAVKLGSSLFDVVLQTIRPGAEEIEVAAELEYAARKAGAEGMSFETIIASGPRSALPHGRASAAKIPAQGFVVCDFGIILAGYCSDMTRTVHVGKPSRKARDMYQAVRQAQQAAVDKVSPGLKVAEVDRTARQVIARAGLGKYFTHSTGHGVGLEIHEAPRIAAGQSGLLRAGMVVTIEPGVYIPDQGGVRIEDMVVVTDRGCEVLTPTGKELIIL
jgi:Xaa-Pro aminopeptidase